MAVNIAVTPGSGATVGTDEVTDASLGGVPVKFQYVKLVGGAVGDTTKVASGTGTGNALRVIMDSSQLASLQTAVQPMSAGYQLVANPTDQAVANKVQSQSNGMTSTRIVSAATANANSIKASAGAGVTIDLFNVAAYDVYFKFFNKASAPTLGGDTPVWTIPIKAGTGYSRTFQFGKWFSIGIAYAITKLQADTDSTVIAAGDVTGTIDWI